MRTIDEIIDKYTICRTFSEGRVESEIKVTEKYLKDDIKQMMKEYAIQIVDQILSAEHQHNLYNGTTVDAVASEWINKIKQQIQDEQV